MKWEYMVSLGKVNNDPDWLNELGEQGWELVSMAQQQQQTYTPMKFYFKRPKKETECDK